MSLNTKPATKQSECGFCLQAIKPGESVAAGQDLHAECYIPFLRTGAARPGQRPSGAVARSGRAPVNVNHGTQRGGIDLQDTVAAMMLQARGKALYEGAPTPIAGIDGNILPVLSSPGHTLDLQDETARRMAEQRGKSFGGAP